MGPGHAGLPGHASRYAEDRLQAAVGAGVRQYILLGAGLDTFAYRNLYAAQGLQVYEVDHPDTQLWKHGLLAAAGITALDTVHYVPVDFETQQMLPQLTAAGFQLGERACVSWLGVTPYLTLPAFRATLHALGSLPPGTSLTFEYMPELSAMSVPAREAIEALMSQVAKVGEPFQLFFAPGAAESELRQAGFSRVEQVGYEELNARYFKGRADGLRLASEGTHLVTAWV